MAGLGQMAGGVAKQATKAAKSNQKEDDKLKKKAKD